MKTRNKENSDQYDKHVDNITTINEFLIDLIGVLVPGGLFLFSIIVSIIIPIIMIYFNSINPIVDVDSTSGNANLFATKLDLLAFNVFSGWFWLVLFFMFLILSYAIGNIFYRLDIKDVDKLSFKWQSKKLHKSKIKPIIKKIRKKDKDFELEKFLEEYFELLIYHLKENRKSLYTDKIKWKDKFKIIEEKSKTVETGGAKENRLIKILNQLAYLLYEKEFKKVLDLVECSENEFEKALNEVMDSVKKKIDPSQNIPDTVKKLLKIYEKHFTSKNKDYYVAICWFFLFYLRSEVACDNEDDCQFPYEHYDTYLIKRGDLDLVKHTIAWCKDKDSRTKNALNTLKLRIQLKSKEAYNILLKNEAHIRMASSSYRVASIVRIIAFVFVIIFLGFLIPFEKNIFSIECDLISQELIKYALVIIGMPIFILFASIYIMLSVKKFLHYQRLREIFFVLQVYDELEKANKKTIIF